MHVSVASRSAQSDRTTADRCRTRASKFSARCRAHFGDRHKDPIFEPAARAASIFDPDKQFWWKPDFSKWVLSCDALTVDPSELVDGMEGIWDTAEKLAEQPILETLLHNASPGDTPRVQAWIVVSAEFGTTVFYPRLATKGGPEGAQDRCEWWYSTLSAAELAHSKEMRYYNRPEALHTHATAAQANRKAADTGVQAEVDHKLFLVSCELVCMHACC